MIKKSIYLVFALLITACAGAKFAAPKESDAQRGAAKFPGLTVADLQHGQMLFKQECGKCHGLYAPASRTEADWRKIVPRMVKKAKLDQETGDAVLKYVVTMSGR